MINDQNPDLIIPKGSKVAVEVLTEEGYFKTKVIRVMANIKAYIFLGVISSRHRGYTTAELLN